MTAEQETFQFPEVRVVEASAGSGKTFALAKRYVQLLLSSALEKEQIPIRHILAVTFTNKAAFEMKARILDFLKRTALKALTLEEEKDILEPLNLTRETASPKAFVLLEGLIHQYNFFQVQTIDSFINALLCGCAFKIGLSANFKIKTSSFDYLEYGLDQTIDRAAHDAKTAKTFENFLRQYLFLENKTNWFPKKDMLDLLAALYRQNNTYGGQFFPYDLKGEDLFLEKQKILKLMNELLKTLPEATDGRFVKSLENFLARYKQNFDIDRVSDYFSREEIPVRAGKEVPASAEKLWKKIRASLRILSEGEAYSLFNPYIEVFEGVMSDFQKKAAHDDVLFLEELNRKARSLFDEGALTVEELYSRLATRFHHYLVDEFQDTSILQWRNLYLMIEEALSTGGSLFYVGDKKQAIYGFRGGEVKLFDDVKKQFSAFSLKEERLTRNYRSQKAIVEFHSKVFSLDNLKRFVNAKETTEAQKNKKDAVCFSTEDLKELENVFAASQQTFCPEKSGGYVKVEMIGGKRKEERDEATRQKLLTLIKELKTRFAYRDMAILTRSNKDVEAVTGWLLAEGIPVESERTLDIKENAVVQELVAFLKFLNSPIDNLSFAVFLAGDVFTKASGLKKEDVHAFLFSLRKRVSAEKDLYLYREFRAAFPDVWGRFIEEFFKGVGLYPLYELVVSILGRLKVLENFEGSQGFVMRFLELIKEHEEESSDIASFLENFEKLENEELFVNVTDTDSIRLLTIHKAKGLEFPVVILPFLGIETHVGAGGGMGQQSYILDFKEDHLELLRIKNKYLQFSPKLSEIRHREYIKSFLSELNSLYVALTRPSQELYVFVPERVGSAFNFATLLIPEEAKEMGAPAKAEGRGTKDEGPATGNARLGMMDGMRLKLPVSKYQDWIDFLKEEFMEERPLVKRREALRGEALHFILSFIGNLKIEKKEERLNEALAQARGQFPANENWEDAKGLVNRLLDSAELKKFFVVEDGEVFQEKDVVTADGQTRRIDRLIVKKDEVWVIDYKSSREETDVYQKQVKSYMEIVATLYPRRTVRGFLIYLDEMDCEEIKYA